MKEVAKRINISIYMLRKYYLIPNKVKGSKRFFNLKKTKQTRRNSARDRYNITRNSNCFNKIDTEIKAYLLGLLAADGNLFKNSLSLASKDFEQIKIFSDYFSCPIRKSDVYRSRFEDYIMSNRLRELGLKENKSLNKGLDILFANIPYKFKKDFVRGFMDGDGSVNNTKFRYMVSFYNTDKKLLSAIRTFINPTSFCITTVPKKNLTLYVLHIWKKENFFKFYHLIYDNSVYYLNRKRNKFIQVKQYEFKNALKGITKSPIHRKHLSEAKNPIISKVLTKKFLYKEYITNKKYCKQIAKEVGCSIPTVCNYFRKYNIKKEK